jgi:hypothetical protein
LNSLKEALTGNVFQQTAQYGKILFFYARLLAVYVFIGIAVFWTTAAFAMRPDVPSFSKFVVTVSIVTVCALFFLKKNAFLSLFPKIPEGNYAKLIYFIRKYYYPLLTVSFVAALLWCLGYENLGRMVLS